MIDGPVLTPLPDVPLVSVWSTVYNHERFVARAIESVLSQDWPRERLQYVVVDDGSSDRSAEIVERYVEHLTFIRQENQGLIAAVNRAFEPLTGDLIMAASGDDMWPAGRIARQVRFMQEHPEASLAYSDLEVIDEHDQVIAPSFFVQQQIIPAEGRITGRLIQGNFINGGPAVLRGGLKSLVWPIPHYAPWDDWWFAYRASLAGEVLLMPGAEYRYRQHDSNLLLGADDRKLAQLMVEEVSCRLWMIANTPRGQVSVDEMIAARGSLEHRLAYISSRLGKTLADIVPPPTDAVRRRASDLRDAARTALGAGAWDAATLLWLRAYAIDPQSDDGAPVLAAAQETRNRLAPVSGASVIYEARRFLVAARLEELTDDPSLMRAFCQAFDDDADATLAIHSARDEPASREAVQVLLDRIGIDIEDTPDLLLLTARDEWSWERLRDEAYATLTRREPPRPRATVGDERGLRELAAVVWRGYCTEAQDSNGDAG
ncbi:MAG: glycosyltransferase [Solirubrobacteraceae bacterium]